MATNQDYVVARVDKARLLLAEAKTPPAAKQIVDMARAAEIYAKRQKLSQETIQYATAIRIDAETLMGELLKVGPKNTGTKGQQLPPGPGRGNKTGGVKPQPPVSDVLTRAQLGISKKEASEAQALAELAKAMPRVHEAVRSGETSRAKAINDLRKSKQSPPAAVITPGFPNGPFATIVIDPPWPVEKITFDRRPNEKQTMDYPTWSLEEIGGLPIQRLADKRGAHVYLWVTHRFLPDGLKLFERWGVRYECLLTWHKPTAMPLWWMFNAEHILFGKVGSLAPQVKGSPVCFNAPQQKHSHKPEVFYDLVRKVSPKKRLTMFDSERDGFTQWGVIHA